MIKRFCTVRSLSSNTRYFNWLFRLSKWRSYNYIRLKARGQLVQTPTVKGHFILSVSGILLVNTFPMFFTACYFPPAVIPSVLNIYYYYYYYYYYYCYYYYYYYFL